MLHVQIRSKPELIHAPAETAIQVDAIPADTATEATVAEPTKPESAIAEVETEVSVKAVVAESAIAATEAEIPPTKSTIATTCVGVVSGRNEHHREYAERNKKTNTTHLLISYCETHKIVNEDTLLVDR